jgi:hypothetical protein
MADLGSEGMIDNLRKYLYCEMAQNESPKSVNINRIAAAAKFLNCEG